MCPQGVRVREMSSWILLDFARNFSIVWSKDCRPTYNKRAIIVGSRSPLACSNSFLAFIRMIRDHGSPFVWFHVNNRVARKISRYSLKISDRLLPVKDCIMILS